MSTKTVKPAPTETQPGKQKDDNIDDLGRKPDGTKLEQPVTDPRDVKESK